VSRVLLSVQSSVVVALPLPAGAEGIVVHSCDGAASATDGTLLRRIPTVSAAAPSGSLDVTVPGEDSDAFFPVKIGFQSALSLSGLDVVATTSADDAGTVFCNDALVTVGASAYVIE
jgi:hypothetical protein